ncbi:Uncharacterised protein [Staphylococcus aureus]|uniref:Uncharacterized protein n=1 Tax=Staphylococcus aureus TaxID=1280 RepID=A0A380EAT6_STAAU|nr:Uncharacterised protein [Staphylococcus aureus]SUL29311.1 Uncharacterised protein [Staphylococcus aureus]
MQMSVSHSVPKYMLIMYYEILIIREEKKKAFVSFGFIWHKFCSLNGKTPLIN